MTALARLSILNGEDALTTIIVLETEFPHMADAIPSAWISHLAACFHAHGALTWDPATDLQNGHLAGDIVEVADERGCGRAGTGNPRCFIRWESPHGGMLYCPWIRVQEGGGVVGSEDEGALTPNGQGQGEENDDDDRTLLFEERVSREMEYQSRRRTFRRDENNNPAPPPALRLLPTTPSPPNDSNDGEEVPISPSTTQAPPLPLPWRDGYGGMKEEYYWPPPAR
ncbi:MAG: hypothetical protein LQ346_005284, partial [Caloplaca aetnensis]